jgi:hypothetical protein
MIRVILNKLAGEICMSLILSNRATDKQLDWLRELGYCGTMQLSYDAAARLIDECIEQERIAMTRDQRDFIKMINQHDPMYLERYKQIKLMGKE